MPVATVVFDLDGTLTDNAEGIIRCAQHALRALSLPVVGDAAIRALIGPPLHRMFPEMGVPAALIDPAIAAYRERFRDVGWLENRVYDGVPTMLSELVEQRCELRVATSKPEVFARQILAHFGLIDRFEFVGGASLDASRIDKADVIAHAVPADRRARAMMVGDRAADVVGARAHGIKCIGILWGYGDREELEGAGAVSIADHPRDVVALTTA